MTWLVALNAAGGIVLASAGLAKLRQPSATSAALRSLGLPSSDSTSRTIGAVEISVGVAGAIAGASWVTWLLAAQWIALFAAAVLLRRRPSVPCGCFGESAPTAVGRGHVAVNFGFALVAVLTALAAEGSLAAAVAAGRGGWVVVGAQIGVVALLVRSVLTDLPAVQAAPSS